MTTTTNDPSDDETTDGRTYEVTRESEAFERRAAMPAQLREGDFLHQYDPWADARASSWVVDDVDTDVGPRHRHKYRLVRTDEGGRGDVIHRTHGEVMSWVGEGAVEYEYQVGDPADGNWESGP